MKVSINSKFLDGPYGGGMKFAIFLKGFLSERGVFVVNDLKDSDIDIILHVNPFPHIQQVSAYSYLEALAYKLMHPKAIIIQRINECDERKGTSHMNRLLLKVSKHSDFIVFISTWLRGNLEASGFDKKKPNKVILNGADSSIFSPRPFTKERSVNEKLKLVTHHWSANMMKGHDVYQHLDALLGNKEYENMFSFTYIGNLPKETVYKNTRLLPPLSGHELAKEIQAHDIYLTATINEPAGMHHVEGAMCGLPLLYRNSGALPEYCGGYGLVFNLENFQEKLLQIKDEYKTWKEKMPRYPNTAEYMAKQYLELFKVLSSNSDEFQIKSSILVRSFSAIAISSYSKVHTFFFKVFFKVKNKFSV